MADTGWVLATAGASGRFGLPVGAYAVWSNPGFIVSDDGSSGEAVCSLDTASVTHRLRATYPTATLATLIPEGSTIDGLMFQLEVFCNESGAALEREAYLTNTTTAGGTNLSTDAVISDTAGNVITWGSSTEQWGKTWTRDMVVGGVYSYFKAELDPEGFVLEASLFADVARVKIFYTPPPPPPPSGEDLPVYIGRRLPWTPQALIGRIS